MPEEPLPSSIQLDLSSPWHVSALFAAAIESTTLYTRLRNVDDVYSSNLGQMTDLLNVFGRQTIANIEMSPIEPANTTRNGNNARGEPITSPYNDSVDDESEAGSQKGTTSLEVDLSSPQDLRLEAGMRRPRKRYVFSQVQTYRGHNIEEKANNKDSVSTDRFGRRRRSKVHQ